MDFGFWILDFGLDEASTDIVWILHKIFPCHADSGRRIFIFTPIFGEMIQFDLRIFFRVAKNHQLDIYWFHFRSFWDAELRQVLTARAAAGTCHAREPQTLETSAVCDWLVTSTKWICVDHMLYRQFTIVTS